MENTVSGFTSTEFTTPYRNAFKQSIANTVSQSSTKESISSNDISITSISDSSRRLTDDVRMLAVSDVRVKYKITFYPERLGYGSGSSGVSNSLTALTTTLRLATDSGSLGARMRDVLIDESVSVPENFTLGTLITYPDETEVMVEQTPFPSASPTGTPAPTGSPPPVYRVVQISMGIVLVAGILIANVFGGYRGGPEEVDPRVDLADFAIANQDAFVSGSEDLRKGAVNTVLSLPLTLRRGTITVLQFIGSHYFVHNHKLFRIFFSRTKDGLSSAYTVTVQAITMLFLFTVIFLSEDKAFFNKEPRAFAFYELVLFTIVLTLVACPLLVAIEWMLQYALRPRTKMSVVKNTVSSNVKERSAPKDSLVSDDFARSSTKDIPDVALTSQWSTYGETDALSRMRRTTVLEEVKQLQEDVRKLRSDMLPDEECAAAIQTMRSQLLFAPFTSGTADANVLKMFDNTWGIDAENETSPDANISFSEDIILSKQMYCFLVPFVGESPFQTIIKDISSTRSRFDIEMSFCLKRNAFAHWQSSKIGGGAGIMNIGESTKEEDISSTAVVRRIIRLFFMDVMPRDALYAFQSLIERENHIALNSGVFSYSGDDNGMRRFVVCVLISVYVCILAAITIAFSPQLTEGRQYSVLWCLLIWLVADCFITASLSAVAKYYLIPQVAMRDVLSLVRWMLFTMGKFARRQQQMSSTNHVAPSSPLQQRQDPADEWQSVSPSQSRDNMTPGGSRRQRQLYRGLSSRSIGESRVTTIKKSYEPHVLGESSLFPMWTLRSAHGRINHQLSLNAASYFFVSQRVAQQFPLTLETKTVQSFHTPWPRRPYLPSNILNGQYQYPALWHYEHAPSGVVSSFAGYFFTYLWSNFCSLACSLCQCHLVVQDILIDLLLWGCIVCFVVAHKALYLIHPAMIILPVVSGLLLYTVYRCCNDCAPSTNRIHIEEMLESPVRQENEPSNLFPVADEPITTISDNAPNSPESGRHQSPRRKKQRRPEAVSESESDFTFGENHSDSEESLDDAEQRRQRRGKKRDDLRIRIEQEVAKQVQAILNSPRSPQHATVSRQNSKNIQNILSSPRLAGDATPSRHVRSESKRTPGGGRLAPLHPSPHYRSAQQADELRSFSRHMPGDNLATSQLAASTKQAADDWLSRAREEDARLVGGGEVPSVSDVIAKKSSPRGSPRARLTDDRDEHAKRIQDDLFSEEDK